MHLRLHRIHRIKFALKLRKDQKCKQTVTVKMNRGE